MQVVFRADASSTTGGGHVVRCLALATGLAEADWSCAFAVRPGTVETVPALAASGFAAPMLNGAADDEAAALKEQWANGVDWVVVDHYERDANFERDCRSWARHVMVIDDLADRAHDCDVLLDQTLGRTEDDYAAYVSKECRFLLGPSFALIRSQFAEARPGVLERRQEETDVRRILLSMGGTDPHGVTGRALQGIADAGVQADVDVVLAGNDDVRPEVEDIADGVSGSVSIHESVEDMAGLMARADLAIGGAGVTSWERCCLALPSLLIVTAENQRVIAQSLNEAGAAEVLGWHADVDTVPIARAVAALSADGARRRDMSKSAAAVCDGLGPGRVREHLS